MTRFILNVLLEYSLLPQTLEPEIALAIACIQTLWQADVLLRSHLESGFNWRRFLFLVQQHQVLPIVYRALTQASLLPGVPAPVKQKLVQRSQFSTQHNLQLMAETLSLLEMFHQAKIRAIPLKGIPLATQLYRNKALRQVRDIDILIEPDSYPLVKQLLEQRGYQTEKPEAQSWSRMFERLYLRQQGEMNWWHEGFHVTVDIHLRLCRNAYALPLNFEQLWATAVSFSSPQISQTQTLTVLSMANQVLFLSVHGANHQWSKLLWLTDLALLTQQSETLGLDWQEVFEQAHQVGVERAIAQGLIMTQLLFGTDIPAPWVRFCQTKPVKFLVAIALKPLLQRQDFEKPGTLTSPPLSLLQIYQELRYTTSLRQSWRYKLSCVTRLLITAKDWQVLPLPSYLWFLYIPLRPVLYFYRWLK